ncbi:hypothetical protein NE237_005863 [Protea cynaroides]|uniref:Uncharacterized protein n=1 Tax=Protea cynaroides TaxID=273540 RepID=A0A9Q0QV04_9MAGN|nr:hypothetical protein NE237_005863 [Protea cynaroides]
MFCKSISLDTKLMQTQIGVDYQAQFEKCSSKISGISNQFLKISFISNLKSVIQHEVLTHQPISFCHAVGLARLQEDRLNGMPLDRGKLFLNAEQSGGYSTTYSIKTIKWNRFSKKFAAIEAQFDFVICSGMILPGFKEIAALEDEVMVLERHLLSLYQKSFEHHLASLPFAVMDKDPRFPLCKTGSVENVTNQAGCHKGTDMQRSTSLNPCQFEELKEKSDPYIEMIEVLSICVDGDKFNYVATMLKKFRSLVERLEKADPNKMKCEEKLAFWIKLLHTECTKGSSYEPLIAKLFDELLVRKDMKPSYCLHTLQCLYLHANQVSHNI